MKIVLVGPGCMPIPSDGWGAVERIVWDYYQLLFKKGYNVVIVNQSNHDRIINECNNYNADIVHIMYDDYIVVVPRLTCKKIFYTSHFAYLTNPDLTTKYAGYYYNIFRKVIDYRNSIILNVISDNIKQIYIKHGFPEERINIIKNGARDDKFIYLDIPSKGERSIYLGKIEYRKGQYKYQSIDSIDFIGNYHDSSFNINRPQYKGEWSKDKLYQEMTNYGNLILLSDGEADPLVVKEALIAGLGVVISECASANLDLSKEFITIIPNEKLKLNDLEYIKNEIDKNRQISIKLRNEIRQYGLYTYSWSNIIDEYCTKCLL